MPKLSVKLIILNIISSFGVVNTSGRLVKVYIIYPNQHGGLESLDHLCKTGTFILLIIMFQKIFFIFPVDLN